jgi:hypothetical protein
MAMRIREAYSKREMESLIDDYITRGYSVKSRGDRTSRLKDVKYGSIVSHVLIFIVFGWWTFLVANILWLAYQYYSGEEVLIKLVDADGLAPESGAAGSRGSVGK